MYDGYVELHHIHLGTCMCITHDEYAEFVTYAGFKQLEQRHKKWYENRIIVGVDEDLFWENQSNVFTEASLASAYHRWYWQHEIETQREYRWLGKVPVKMPMDLFFYQELIYSQSQSRIIEVGYGRGGGLYFIHTIMRLLNRKGTLVGIDYQALPAEEFDHHYEPCLIQGDARDICTLEKVKNICPEYDLLILDLGGCENLSLQLLPMWSQLIAPGGFIIVEDVWADADQRPVIQVLDTFLIQNRHFGLYLQANRYPFLKGIVLQRLE